MKIIIVASESSFGGTADKFLKMIKKLLDIFPDPKIVLQGITLVITKAINIKTIEDIKESYLQTILK